MCGSETALGQGWKAEAHLPWRLDAIFKQQHLHNADACKFSANRATASKWMQLSNVCDRMDAELETTWNLSICTWLGCSRDSISNRFDFELSLAKRLQKGAPIIRCIKDNIVNVATADEVDVGRRRGRCR